MEKIEGQLEIDREKRVIWFNSYPYGKCRLRICGLTEEQINRLYDEDAYLDITLRE